jgi:hypothetical protein
MPTVRFEDGTAFQVSGPVNVVEDLKGNTTVNLTDTEPVRVDPPGTSLKDLFKRRVVRVEKDAQPGLLGFRNPDLPLGVVDEVKQEIRIGPKGKTQVLPPIKID